MNIYSFIAFLITLLFKGGQMDEKRNEHIISGADVSTGFFTSKSTRCRKR